MGLIKFNSKFMKYGLPFILFVVGGSIGLKEFCQLRIEFRRQKSVGRREAIMSGLEDTGIKFSIEKQYEEIKKMDLDNWENKRIPRPWEPQEEENKKQEL